MGTHVPINKEGLPCPICWGSDKPFGELPTPKYIIVRFSGLLPGELYAPDTPFPPLEVWVKQDPDFPCTFTGSVNNYGVVLRFEQTQTFLSYLHNDPNYGIFFKFQAGKCQKEFQNGINDPENNYFYGGIATISWKWS